MHDNWYKIIQKLVRGVFWVTFLLFFINLSIFVREYRARKACIPHLNERYVTKPQTSHNNMQKTRPRYLNLERFYWGSVFARRKKHSVDLRRAITRLESPRQAIGSSPVFYSSKALPGLYHHSSFKAKWWWWTLSKQNGVCVHRYKLFSISNLNINW